MSILLPKTVQLLLSICPVELKRKVYKLFIVQIGVSLSEMTIVGTVYLFLKVASGKPETINLFNNAIDLNTWNPIYIFAIYMSCVYISTMVKINSLSLSTRFNSIYTLKVSEILFTNILGHRLDNEDISGNEKIRLLSQDIETLAVTVRFSLIYFGALFSLFGIVVTALIVAPYPFIMSSIVRGLFFAQLTKIIKPKL